MTIAVSDEELHAWLDDELPPERRRAVGEWLNAHPADARRLEAYRRDGAAIARIFSAPALSEPRAAQRPKSAAWIRPLLAAAAAVVIAILGATAGWIGHDRASGILLAFGQEAAAVHALGPRLAGSEVAFTTTDGLADRISEHVGTRIRLPSFQDLGYALASARLLPSPEGAAAQIVLRSVAGDEATVYLRALPGASDSPFRTLRHGTVTTVAWEGDDIICAITGTASADKLQALGRRLYDAIEAG